jgi:DNA repair protein RAD16
MDLSSDDEAASGTTSSHARAAKDLRRSIYSMNPSNSRVPAIDLEDDEDDDDYSPDHVLAKRLQDEEYADASVEDLKQNNARATRNSLRLSNNSGAILTPPSASSSVSTRRAREESSTVEAGPPAKRARGMIPTPSESGTNSAEGTEAQPTPSTGPPRALPRARNSTAQAAPRRRNNASFIPASQLLQYGNNPHPPPPNGDTAGAIDLETESEGYSSDDSSVMVLGDTSEEEELSRRLTQASQDRRRFRNRQATKAAETFRGALEKNHPEILTLWKELEEKPLIRPSPAPQPTAIHRQMKPFQLEGLAWMKEMEASEYKGGVLGDEMGLGKTIQAVSLIMSDFPAGKPSLVLVPPVALLQWVSEIDSYTDKALKTFVFHGTNQNTKSIKLHELKKYDVIMMSYNSLEAMYRRETKGQVKKKKNDDSTIEVHKTDSIIHKIDFHRVILDEAHGIKTRNTSTAKACFALKGEYRWCLTGTPLQNVIGEYFSLIQFLRVRPFSSYLCRNCPCVLQNWAMNEDKVCVCE